MRRQQSFAIILIGRSVLIREGFARILRSANFRILASGASADDLPSARVQSRQPLFLLIHTGDDFEAVIDQIENFKDRHQGARIAIVADRYRLEEMVSAFRAGANGYFVDIMTCDVFVKSMELVMMGETVFPPAFPSFVLDAKAGNAAATSNHAILVTADDTVAPQLSPRENSILRYLIEGDSNKSIARKIDIAEATVKVHVKAILRKIRVQNRTQAAIWGMNNGSLIRPASNNSASSINELTKRLPRPVEVISEVKQIDEPASADVSRGKSRRGGADRPPDAQERQSKKSWHGTNRQIADGPVKIFFGRSRI
jgi:DNA-binding NarL/FixJ family response regulator